MGRLLVSFTFAVVLGLVLAQPANTDCRGCCSHHGEVVCKNGVTQCRDGTPLSDTCEAKGCDKCGGNSKKKKDRRS